MVENVTQEELATIIQSIKNVGGDFDAETLQNVLRQELYRSLPNIQKKRVRAARFLEKQCRDIDDELEKKIFELTETYQPRYATLRAKRMEIVTGVHEPTEEEAPEDDLLDGDDEDENEDGPMVEEVSDDGENTADGNKEGEKDGAAAKESKKPEDAAGEDDEEEVAIGIPGFWIQVFEHANIEFEDIDEAVLQSLIDVRYQNVDMHSFRLIFEFAENEFFENKTLTLVYTPPNEEAGEEMGALSGCDIDWKKGKRLTAKTMTKKQQSTRTKKTRTVTREVPVKSFFGLFELNLKQTDIELWDEVEEHLYSVSEVVHKMRYQVIPDATSFFLDLVSDDEDDEDDEDDDDYEDDDDSEEEDIGVLGRGTKPADKGEQSTQPPECNPQ